MSGLRIYCGARHPDGTTSVTADGRPLSLRQDFREHSATTFEWGYAGSGGPAQLALAILADHLADDEKVRRHYQLFLQCVVRHLPRIGWTLTGQEIEAALPGSS